MTIQYIKDEEGKDQYVVIPYSDYFRMRLALLEYDDEDENNWEDISYESDIYDLDDIYFGCSFEKDTSCNCVWKFPFRLFSKEHGSTILGYTFICKQFQIFKYLFVGSGWA